MGKHEVKKDFLALHLVDNQGKEICKAIDTGRQPFTEDFAVRNELAYVDFIDKSYYGINIFESKCFENKNVPLKLVINIEGNDSDKVMNLPEKTRKLIVRDFVPYWKHVAKVSGSNPLPVSSEGQSSSKKEEPSYAPITPQETSAPKPADTSHVQIIPAPDKVDQNSSSDKGTITDNHDEPNNGRPPKSE